MAFTPLSVLTTLMGTGLMLRAAKGVETSLVTRLAERKLSPPSTDAVK